VTFTLYEPFASAGAIVCTGTGMATAFEVPPRVTSFADGFTLPDVPLAPAPAGDWRLSARVRVNFRDTYDAGVPLIWNDERHWAKLCFERSPAGIPTVVNVVFGGVRSDDVPAGRTERPPRRRLTGASGRYPSSTRSSGVAFKLHLKYTSNAP
jgi:hypothetical protein